MKTVQFKWHCNEGNIVTLKVSLGGNNIGHITVQYYGDSNGWWITEFEVKEGYRYRGYGTFMLRTIAYEYRDANIQVDCPPDIGDMFRKHGILVYKRPVTCESQGDYK